MTQFTTGPAAAVTVPDAGWAVLKADGNPALAVFCELGDRPPVPTQGYGGFDQVERQGRVSLTPWRGFKAFGIDLALMLDGHATGRGIETAFAMLEALAGRGELATGDEPPVLIVDTAGVMPHDYTASKIVRWRIDDLQIDAASVLASDAGNWTRAAVTVQLLQHVADQGLAAQTANARAQINAATPRATRTIPAKAGDTLTSIARAHLGDAGRWRELAALNPSVRDPRQVLKTGTKIRVP